MASEVCNYSNNFLGVGRGGVIVASELKVCSECASKILITWKLFCSGLDSSRIARFVPWDIISASPVAILKGPYADHILIPQGATGSSYHFGVIWKPIFFSS